MSDHEESEEGVECVTCNEIFSDDGKCIICSEPQCKDCSVEKDIINLTEWLINCPNKCNKCKRIGCENCITTCYSCANEGENCEFLCNDCSHFVQQDCKYHSNWTLCEKHAHQKCAECSANRNYSDKHY